MKVRFFRFLDRALIGVPIVVFVAFFLYGGSKQKIMSNKKATLMNSQMDITAVNWNGRGAWDDSFRLDFSDGWVFPWGSNHLSSVEVLSKGEVWPRWNDTNRIAALDVPLAIVPGITQFSYFRTPSDSYILSWNNAAIDRNTNILTSAAIELRRDGERIVTQNGISMATARELPFCRIGWGQDEDWIEHYFSNEVAEIKSVGYLDWVDSIALEPGNGFYKLTVTLSNAPPETVNLTVGDYSVAVTNAGSYVFLLEKGVRYPIGFSFLPEGVAYSLDDGGPAEPPEPDWPEPPGQSRGAPHDVYYYTYSTTGDYGHGQELVIPDNNGDGHACWWPLLLISPEYGDSLSPYTSFSATVFDIPTNAIPDIIWESGGSFLKRGTFLELENTHFYGDKIDVTAVYRNVVLHGTVPLTRHVRATGIDLTGGGVILTEGPHLGFCGEPVPATSLTGASLNLWWALASPGTLRLESNCGGSVSVRASGSDEPVSLPLEWHADMDDAGQSNLVVEASGVMTNGQFTFTLEFDDDRIDPIAVTTLLAVVELEVEAEATWPTNRHRHVFGPKERFTITTNPSVGLSCSPLYGSEINGNTVIAPDRPGSFAVGLTIGDIEYDLCLLCIAPVSLQGKNPRTFLPIEWMNHGRYQIPVGYPGVGMHIDTWLEPKYVSFKHLRVYEGYAPAINRQGWYTDIVAFPVDELAHDYKAGATNETGAVKILDVGNLQENGDYVAAWMAPSTAYTNGSYQVSIPVYWFAEGGGYTNNLPDSVQKTWVIWDGTMGVSKNGCAMERSTNGVYTVIYGQ
jgi:hypothetical protein